MERLLDLGARALGLDPVAVRRVNLIGPADLPYTSATRLVHDCGSYPLCFEKAVEAIDYAAVRAEQARLRREGRYLGIGFANYNELTGLGQAASAGPRMPFRTGHEGATVRMDPSGAVTVLAGVTSQGQGLETTMAQLVAAELGLPLDAGRGAGGARARRGRCARGSPPSPRISSRRPSPISRWPTAGSRCAGCRAAASRCSTWRGSPTSRPTGSPPRASRASRPRASTIR